MKLTVHAIEYLNNAFYRIYFYLNSIYHIGKYGRRIIYIVTFAHAVNKILSSFDGDKHIVKYYNIPFVRHEEIVFFF